MDPVLEGKRVPCAYRDVLLNVGDIKVEMQDSQEWGVWELLLVEEYKT